MNEQEEASDRRPDAQENNDPGLEAAWRLTKLLTAQMATSKALAAKVKKREAAISARDDRIQQLQWENQQANVQLQIALKEVAEIDARRREVFAKIDAMTAYMEELSRARREQEDGQIPSGGGEAASKEPQDQIKPKLANKAVQTEPIKVEPQLVQELKAKFEILKVEQAKRLSENEAIMARAAQMSSQAEHATRAARAPEAKTPNK